MALLQLQLPTGEGPLDILSSISVGTITEAALVLAVAWLVVRGSDRIFNRLGDEAPRARFFFKMLAPVVRFAVWGLVTFMVISIFAPSRETLLALLASMGIALGLGGQDLVKNIIGGLVILVDRPYQLGDRVKIGDAYGEIDHIGLISTKLTTPDDTHVTIPNSEILTGKAWNANSGVPDCQVVTDLFLPTDTDPRIAMEIGYEAAFTSPYLLLAKPVVVLVLDKFEHHPHLMVRVKAYVYDHRFEPRFQSDVTLRAKSEFIRRGLLREWRGSLTASASPADA
ncbi:MAG: mechanosensitive ion channel [Gemmatimonadota bacterium]|nr:mechanosensitive ion channel [Gemmatimonadota bacterium]